MSRTDIAKPREPGGTGGAAAAAVQAGPEGLPHPAHHFDSLSQQSAAAGLGMWLFLATEVLLFGGLFCVYAVCRAGKPEAFDWGRQFLDLHWGAINTVILLSSSLTFAWAVRCAQRDQQRGLTTLLLLTLLGGGAFLAVKYVEYQAKLHHGLLWGRRFRPDPHYVAARLGLPPPAKTAGPQAAEAAAPEVSGPATPDVKRGRELFVGTCASCHGASGEGLPGLGQNLRESEFLGTQSDEQLVAFLREGRRPWDPASKLKIDMPPRGGNPMIRDEDLQHIAAYLKTLRQPGATQAAGDPAREAAAGAGEPEALVIHRSFLPLSAIGPAGLASAVQPSPTDPPVSGGSFFGVYFLLTGLHGLHVTAGLLVIVWLFRQARRGRFGPRYYTPLAMGGLYWHLVDIIWLYLFPLLYLQR